MKRTAIVNAILSCTALIGLGAAAAPSSSWATEAAFAEATPKVEASKGAPAADPAPSAVATSGNGEGKDMGSPEGKVANKKVNNLQGVQVVAPRTSIESARFTQEQAPNLINIRTGDQIRSLPDVNTAEALRRIPGVSLETDEGEGRYVNIRGFDADLNSTTYAGVRLLPTNNASPFGGYRGVALDSIPTGFIGAVQLTKSNLPSQDAEALGGAIAVLPKTAPAAQGPFFEGDIGGGYEPLRGTPVSKFSLVGGGRFGPFSIVLTASGHTDSRGIDDVEPAYFNLISADPQPAVA